MYDYMPIIFGIVLLVLAIVMIVNPKASTKAEFREMPDKVEQIKKNGFVILLCGIILIVMGIVMLLMKA